MLADYVKTIPIFVQLSATNPNSTTHNGSQHGGGRWLPSPIKTSLQQSVLVQTAEPAIILQPQTQPAMYIFKFETQVGTQVAYFPSLEMHAINWP